MRDPFEGAALPAASKQEQPPDALPVSRLDATQIPLAHRFDAWHEGCAPLFDTTCLGDPDRFDVGAICYLVDRLMFTRVHFERMHFSRGTPQLSSGESDCITVQHYRRGSVTGRLDDGTPLHMAPDRISIHDYAHAYTSVGETTESFGVIIPRHLLTGHDYIYRRSPMFSWSLDFPSGPPADRGAGGDLARVATRYPVGLRGHRLGLPRAGQWPAGRRAGARRSDGRAVRGAARDAGLPARQRAALQPRGCRSLPGVLLLTRHPVPFVPALRRSEGLPARASAGGCVPRAGDGARERTRTSLRDCPALGLQQSVPFSPDV